MNIINKIVNIIRNIFGADFILFGILGAIFSSFMAGFCIVLAGAALLPIFYEKIKFVNFKYSQIVLPIVFIVISIFCMPKGNNENAATETESTSVVAESEIVAIESLKFSDSELELDIKETKNIDLEISPSNAQIENLEYFTSDDKIAILEATNSTNNGGKITLQIKPFAEGNCEVFVKSGNGIESNKVSVKVTDKEKLESENRTQEEEQKIETQTKKEDSKKTQDSSDSNTKSSRNLNNTHGAKVYRTPNGKRYHYDPDCGGKNSTETTLEKAKAAGLTPCQKCAH